MTNPDIKPSYPDSEIDQAQPYNKEAVIELLESWCQGDEEEQKEQKETWVYLKKTLDEDRLSDRKLFP
jgi:hypothetical protein